MSEGLIERKRKQGEHSDDSIKILYGYWTDELLAAKDGIVADLAESAFMGRTQGEYLVPIHRESPFPEGHWCNVSWLTSWLKYAFQRK